MIKENLMLGNENISFIDIMNACKQSKDLQLQEHY